MPPSPWLGPWRWGFFGLGLGISAAVCLPAAAATEPHRVEVLSKTYTLDRKYRSMEGPAGMQKVSLLPSEPAELVWITGYQVVIVGPDGKMPVSQEFMCHNNLDFNPARHNALFSLTQPVSSRLFTLSQGFFAIRFPDGFGLPVRSDEPLSMTTQVLNHNVEPVHVQVRHKGVIEFIRDRDLTEPLKPLFSVAPFVMVLLEGRDGYFGLEEADPATQGVGCLPGQHAPTGTPTGLYTDRFGRRFSGHWVVKPGKQVYRTTVTRMMNLQFDTTLHYAAVHVHPYAESLELRDLTTGKTVFTSRITNAAPPRVGLVQAEAFSSVQGVPLYHDHEYEMISVYDNTTPTDQDAMATLFLYLLDTEFPARVSRDTGAASTR